MTYLKCALLLGLSSPCLAAPVGYLSKSDRSFQPIEKAILETEEGYLYRESTAKDEDFENLYWVDLEDAAYDRFTLETLGRVELMSEGKFAVLHISPSNVDHVAGVLHDQRSNCGQLIRLTGDEVVTDRAVPVAVPVIPLAERISAVSELQAQMNEANIEATVLVMSSLPTRYSKNAAAGNTTKLLVNSYSQWPREDVTVTTFAHKTVPLQPSLIVRIEGAVHPEEVIILGSHIDSISSPTSQAPGADDNASGTASHLEVFRVIMENNLRFDRTIEIHGYAAEELGLIGSQDIAKAYAAAKTKVVAMLQNDMNMYRSNDKDTVWLITNDTDSRLTKDVIGLAKTYQANTVAVNSGYLAAGSSDHRAWTRQGYATVFPTENPNAYNHAIHTTRDTIANSGVFTQSREFSKLSLSFLAHFAGLIPQ
jgi:leucyl aminopeptidase